MKTWLPDHRAAPGGALAFAALTARASIVICGLLVVAVGCGDGGGNGDAGGEVTWDPSVGTAAVSGVVKFTGTPPRRRPIDMGAREECIKLHTEPVLDQTVIVNPNGTLKNVFVWVKRGLRDWTFAIPSEPVVLDQKACMFHPHVQGVQVGQQVLICNSDPFGHNVHSFAKLNRGFNFGQPTQGQKDIKTFDYREVMVRFKCDIHGWMSSYLGVVPHPYFAVTGEDGTFELKDLPPGDYTIEAWHEAFGTKTAKVTVADNESKDIEFSFQGN